MIIVYVWIAICVGFVLGAVWAGLHQNGEASEKLDCRPETCQWVRPTLDQ